MLSSEGWVGNSQVNRQTVAGIRTSIAKALSWKGEKTVLETERERLCILEREGRSAAFRGWRNTSWMVLYPTLGFAFCNSQPSCFVQKRRKADRGKTNREAIAIRAGQEAAVDWVVVDRGRSNTDGNRNNTSPWSIWYHGEETEDLHTTRWKLQKRPRPLSGNVMSLVLKMLNSSTHQSRLSHRQQKPR